MKKSAICITLATLALAGCNNDEKNAQARLDNARSMYEQNEFFAAKNEIDSIRILYPKEFKVIREGLTLMRQVEQKEAERNLAFCDSLIPVKQQELEGLKKGFNFEKDSAYNEIGNYVSKQQTIERNIQRCYIRSGVNEKGEMYLASVYFGGKPINHTGIKLSTGRTFRRNACHSLRRRPELPFQGLGEYDRSRDLSRRKMRRCRQVHFCQ